MTPRENMLATLRCKNPKWIPVCLSGLHPHAHPTKDIPKELSEALDHGNVSWENESQLQLIVGDYLGAEDNLIPVRAPAALQSETCSARSERLDSTRTATILSTPEGDLRQVATSSESAPSFVTERYVKTAEDAVKLTSYFDSLRVATIPDNVAAARAIKARVGDQGVLFCRTAGTPLGMCYRVYSELPDLIFLIMDEPATMEELFAVMEAKYLQLDERMLQDAPEIDAFAGMDDTSTTLISPSMFEQFNL